MIAAQVSEERLAAIAGSLEPVEESTMCICGHPQISHWNPSSACYCESPMWQGRELTESAHIAAELIALRRKVADWQNAVSEIRDAVLYERYGLAEQGASGDVINAVLGIIDDYTPDAAIGKGTEAKR